MATASHEFKELARRISSRISDLLQAEVTVVDASGAIVASTAGWYSPDATARREHGEYLRVPIRSDDYQGEVVIAHPTGTEAASPKVARLLVELMIHQIVTSTQAEAQAQLKERFMHDLLHGVLRDEASILRDAERFGMDLTIPRVVLLVGQDKVEDVPEYNVPNWQKVRETRLRTVAESICSSVSDYFRAQHDAIYAHIGGGDVVVLKATGPRDPASGSNGGGGNGGTAQANGTWGSLQAARQIADDLLQYLKQEIAVPLAMGVGRYHAGLLGLARSYEDAHTALWLGRHFKQESRVYSLDELGIVAFIGLADEQTKAELGKYLLAPLQTDLELLGTLDVYFAENCVPSEAARRLNVHRNTLSYRLDKIANLTGLDPRRFDEAVQLRMALLLRTLSGPNSDTPNGGTRGEGRRS